ncbi:MAG: hypothetical protein CSA62_09495 [Planctomycetota bacterium]|nr:MAG: hypothetical protein CSA62_09495 [Planctomycetota bacterium]
MSSDQAPRARRIRASQVRVEDGKVLSSAASCDSGGLQLRPILENGIVRRIEVLCSCGQQMTVVCVYPEAGDEGE